jgi:3-methyladenine DNA glycosylase AlkD
MNTEQWVRLRLMEHADEGYRDFFYKLIPNVDPGTVIGVRTPALRALGREVRKRGEAEDFFACLPHRYYEENNLHACLVSQIRDVDTLLRELERFLPYVDNWATCDMIRPARFKERPEGLTEHIRRWLKAEHPFTVRFGMEMLMQYYLDEGFRPEHLAWAAGVEREEYYIRMMSAWYFATALAMQYEAAVPWLRENRLPLWTHNKTIQKATESHRLTREQKEYLRTLRRRA